MRWTGKIEHFTLDLLVWNVHVMCWEIAKRSFITALASATAKFYSFPTDSIKID
jgi:hypothetical protein